MALTVVTGFVMRHMGRVTSYVRARAQHEYNELSLNVETKLWQIKVCFPFADQRSASSTNNIHRTLRRTPYPLKSIQMSARFLAATKPCEQKRPMSVAPRFVYLLDTQNDKLLISHRNMIVPVFASVTRRRSNPPTANILEKSKRWRLSANITVTSRTQELHGDVKHHIKPLAIMKTCG
jgi:hypothetical protein